MVAKIKIFFFVFFFIKTGRRRRRRRRLCFVFFFPFFGLVSISTRPQTHTRTCTRAHAHAPLGTRASQSASSRARSLSHSLSRGQEQALLLYDEEQLLFLARSLTGGCSLAPLSPLMTQVAFCAPLLHPSPPSSAPPTPPLLRPDHFAVSVEGYIAAANDKLTLRPVFFFCCCFLSEWSLCFFLFFF